MYQGRPTRAQMASIYAEMSKRLPASALEPVSIVRSVGPAKQNTTSYDAGQWDGMTPQQKADLYLRDRATYERLKAASEAHKRGVPSNATWGSLTNSQREWLAHHDRPRFDRLRAQAQR